MAKAKPVETTAEFLAVLEKSTLLADSSLESARAACNAIEDPKLAARKLLADGLITQWQATQLLAGFAGLVIGKYKLLDVLSKSELGRVYLAEQSEPPQKVVLYAIIPKGVADAKRVRQIAEDIRFASDPERRALAGLVNVLSDQERYFLATDLPTEGTSPLTIQELLSKLRSLNHAPSDDEIEPPPISIAPTASTEEPFTQSDESDGVNEADDDANVDSDAIPSEDLAGFRVKKKLREPASGAGDVTSTASAEDLAKQQQKRMLLTIIGVAAALLILITCGIIALVSAGRDKEVAQTAAPVVTKQEPPPITDPYGGGPPIVAVDAGLSTVAPSSALASLTGTPASTNATAVSAFPASTTTPFPTLDAKLATSGSSPTAEKKSDAKVEPKPEVKPEPKPESQPAPQAEAPKKTTPPGRIFELAAAVDLPPLPSTDESPSESATKALGRVNADEQTGCFISLLGGTSAMKGKTELAIRSAQGGTAPRDWEIYAREATDAEPILAKLSLPQNELNFEWTAEASKHLAAPHLRNCALRITVGSEKPHMVALRTPVSGTGTSLGGIDKSPITLKFDVDAAPDPAAIRVEPKISELKMVMEQPSAGDKNKQDQWMYLGDGGSQSILHVRLATSTTAKGIQITLTPYLVLPQEKPQRLTPALKKSFASVGVLQEQRRMVEIGIAEMAKLPKEKKNAAKEMEFSVNRTMLDEKIKKLQQFDTVLQKLGAAQIQVRVYHDAGDAQIDLVRTGN